MTEGCFNEVLQPYAYLFRIDLAHQATGYLPGQFVLALGMLVGIRTIYMIVAFAWLMFMYPSEQR